MQAIKFPQSNDVLRRPSGVAAEDCKDLPIWRGLEEAGNDHDEVASCWGLTWRERIAAFVFGRVWLRVWGRTHPPLSLEARRTMFETRVTATETPIGEPGWERR